MFLYFPKDCLFDVFFYFVKNQVKCKEVHILFCKIYDNICFTFYKTKCTAQSMKKLRRQMFV